MKKTVLFVLSMYSFILLNAQIKVASNGYVGINNTSPGYNLDVSGTVQFNYNSSSIRFTGSEIYPSGNGIYLGNYSYRWAQLWAVQPYFTYQPVILSDVNFKTNVKELTGQNLKLKMLRPVKYELTIKENNVANTAQNNEQYGFIAQELMEVFPEIVVPMGEGVMGIRYDELIPVLVQALKEQQAEIEMLKKEITNIKAVMK